MKIFRTSLLLSVTDELRIWALWKGVVIVTGRTNGECASEFSENVRTPDQDRGREAYQMNAKTKSG